MSSRVGWTAFLAAALSLAVAHAAERPASNSARGTGETETLKERLSDKASDEQRVDNCHVAPERRGSKPRPGCSPRRVNGDARK
jgi:hypothetical protein